MLTHFSDIDSQGHCCGVLPEHNDDNTYGCRASTVHRTRSSGSSGSLMYRLRAAVATRVRVLYGRHRYVKAIATKAEHLKQMLEAMEPGTVAIVIADHGHVDVGGHGGVDAVLRDIPLYV